MSSAIFVFQMTFCPRDRDGDDDDVMSGSGLPPNLSSHLGTTVTLCLDFRCCARGEEPELTSDGLMRSGQVWGGRLGRGKQWYDVMSSRSDYQSNLNSSLANISPLSSTSGNHQPIIREHIQPQYWHDQYLLSIFYTLPQTKRNNG